MKNRVFGYIVNGSFPAKSEGNMHCGLIADSFELGKAIKEFWVIQNMKKCVRFLR